MIHALWRYIARNAKNRAINYAFLLTASNCKNPGRRLYCFVTANVNPHSLLLVSENLDFVWKRHSGARQVRRVRLLTLSRHVGQFFVPLKVSVRLYPPNAPFWRATHQPVAVAAQSHDYLSFN
jgi:hypothetical protein